MGPTRRWTVLLLPVVCFISTCCTQRDSSPICRIRKVVGTAQVRLASSKNTITATKGIELKAGDHVLTREKSSVVLEFADFATVVLGENSEYVVIRQACNEKTGILETTSRLLQGIGLVKVDPGRGRGFRIESPHAVTGVLGTLFGLDVLEDETILAVVEGIVDFSCPGDSGGMKVKGNCCARCDGNSAPMVIKHSLQGNSKLVKALKEFIKQKDQPDGKTIFRYY